MSRGWFVGTLLKGSIAKRRTRFLVAIISVVIGVSIASAMLNISFDVGERMGNTFGGYGPNILIVPKDAALQVSSEQLSFGSVSGEKFIKESDITQIERLPSSQYLVGYAPYLYAVIDTNPQKMVLAGVWFDQVMKLNPTWQLSGEPITNRNDNASAIIGINVAERLRLKVGDALRVQRESRHYEFHIIGIISTGGSEDDQMLVSLAKAQAITQKEGLVHTIEARYKSSNVNLKSISQEISKSIPSADVKIVSQVAEAEQSFLTKIQTTITILTLALLAASGLAVMSTMSTTVLERRREIGLMLALGASAKRIIQLFLAEALAIGIVGGFFGYLLGLVFASTIWMNIFNTPIVPRLATIPATLAVAVTVSVLASVPPVRQALRVDPSATLGSE